MENPKPYWQQDLEEANAKFEKFGIKIVITEADGFYRGTIVKGDGSEEVYADNYYESELEELVHDTVEYVKGFVKEFDGLKLFIVTYVGMSDNEYDANGYCEVKPFFSKKKAEEYMQELVSNELESQKEFKPEIVENEPNHIRIEWSGGYEQLRVELHEKEIG